MKRMRRNDYGDCDLIGTQFICMWFKLQFQWKGKE